MSAQPTEGGLRWWWPGDGSVDWGAWRGWAGKASWMGLRLVDAQNLDNMETDIVDVVQDLVVPEAQDHPAVPFQGLRAPEIVQRLWPRHAGCRRFPRSSGVRDRRSRQCSRERAIAAETRVAPADGRARRSRTSARRPSACAACAFAFDRKRLDTSACGIGSLQSPPLRGRCRRSRQRGVLAVAAGGWQRGSRPTAAPRNGGGTPAPSPAEPPPPPSVLPDISPSRGEIGLGRAWRDAAAAGWRRGMG